MSMEIKHLESAIKLICNDEKCNQKKLPTEPCYISGCYDEDREDRAERREENGKRKLCYNQEMAEYYATNFTLKEINQKIIQIQENNEKRKLLKNEIKELKKKIEDKEKKIGEL